MKKFNSLVFFCLTLFLITIFNSKDVQANPANVRLGGLTRYSTAIKISQDGWKNSPYVVMVSGEDFPDALCASPLAKKYNAPILSTAKGGLSDETLKEITRLEAKNAFIVGGPGVISENVDKQLKDLGLSSTRVYGEDRHATSIEVAKLLDITKGAVIAYGYDFPDALSIGSIASQKGMPILLVNKNSIPVNIKTLLNSTNSLKYVIGGTGVITEDAVKSINNYERIGGIDRYDTNLKVINKFIEDIDFTQVYVAIGQDYPDALAGSAAAALHSSPMVLASKQYCGARDILRSKLGDMDYVKILGGETIISNELINNILYGTKTLKTVMAYGACFYSEDTYSYNSLVKNSNTIDAVATAFFNVNGQGTITGVFPEKHVTYGNDNSINTLVSISNNFDQALATELLRSNDNIQNFINNLLNTLNKYNYKGVNIDIEHVSAADRDYFTSFMNKVYTTLKPKGFNVNVAVPAQTIGTANMPWVSGYNYKEISKYSDEVIIMTYDEHYSTGSPGPIASIGWVENVIKYASSMIPKEKILLGIAGYGYDWGPTGRAKAYSIDGAYALATKYGAEIKWDAVSKTPYFNYTDENGLAHSVWFENDQSISYKLDLVNKYNLNGIALWRLGLENESYWEVINSKFAYPY